MKDPYIEIEYEDGRIVEGQCSGLLRFVLSERAKCCTDADEATLRTYVDGLNNDELEAVKTSALALMPAAKQPDDDEEDADEIDETTETEVEVEEDSDGEVNEATDDNPKDGWPTGITVDQKGAYFDLTGSDGNRIDSGTPTGKFHGENVAQEAAWMYENALRAEG